jgi:hypothetical protein
MTATSMRPVASDRPDGTHADAAQGPEARFRLIDLFAGIGGIRGGQTRSAWRPCQRGSTSITMGALTRRC